MHVYSKPQHCVNSTCLHCRVGCNFGVSVKSLYQIRYISLLSCVHADVCAFTSLIQVNGCLSQLAGNDIGVMPQSITVLFFFHTSLFKVLSDTLCQAAAGLSAYTRLCLCQTYVALIIYCHCLQVRMAKLLTVVLFRCMI